MQRDRIDIGLDEPANQKVRVERRCMAVLFFAGFNNNGNKKLALSTQNVSLQVHWPFKTTRLAGRVHPCASSLPASMTVEAALVLPLTLFFFLALLQPVTWLDRQRKVQTAMERIGEEISQYGILAESVENGENELPAFCTDAAAALWIRGRAGQYADHVTIKKSDVYGENGEIEFAAEYQEKLPFFAAVLGKQTETVAVKRRSWIGIPGKLKGDGAYQDDGSRGQTEMVYVGAGMGRYHLFRDCHYISNEYMTVTRAEAENGRIPGEKRTPCAICGKKGDGSETVYITAAGEHYHYDKNCRSMMSYVQEIPKAEAEHLGLCSYCERKKGEME